MTVTLPPQPAGVGEGRPTGIPVRRPRVDLATADIDRWLVPGDPFFSHLLAALSAVFPNGEDFFVDSVRHFRDRVEDDPEMKAKVKGFIGQEAMHGREHRVLNERLEELGYPAAWLDRELFKAAKRLQRLPRSVQLSVTAASEHFTSVMAEAVLGDEQTRETMFPHAETRILITWHALEELEHKDVAFDLLQEVHPGYFMRQLGLVVAAAGFGTVVVRGYLRGVLRDWRHLTPAVVRRHSANYRRQRMVGHRSFPELLRYVRPGFHPRKWDTDHLVTEWRERLAPDMIAHGRRADAGAAQGS